MDKVKRILRKHEKQRKVIKNKLNGTFKKVEKEEKLDEVELTRKKMFERETVLKQAVERNPILKDSRIKISVPIYNKGFVYQGSLERKLMVFYSNSSVIYYKKLKYELKKDSEIRKIFPESERW